MSPWFEVECHGTAREVYHVEADDEDDARTKIEGATPMVSEVDNTEVVAVTPLGGTR